MRRLASVLALLALAVSVAACSFATNGPYGAYRLDPPTIYRKSSTTKTTGPTATTPESSESTCEGGVCVPSVPAK